MNIVFGNLAGDFNQYFVPGSGLSEQTFKDAVNRNRRVMHSSFIPSANTTQPIYRLLVHWQICPDLYLHGTPTSPKVESSLTPKQICFRLMSLQASAALRLEYLQALFASPISKLDEISAGTVTNTITSLSNQIQQSISDRLAILFQSLALLVAAYAIAFRYSWALTLVVSAAILFVVIGFSVTVPFIVKAQQRVDKADDKHISIAADVLGSICTRAFPRCRTAIGQKALLVD